MPPSTLILRGISIALFRKMPIIPGNLRLLHGLAPNGDLVHNVPDTSPILEQSARESPAVRALILNRLSALNALNLHMISAIYNRLRSFELSNKINCVIICSNASDRPAFCAGGDVRNLYYLGIDRRFERIDQFFRAEYTMNSLIASLKNISIVSILDGIVMGGGVGLMIYGKYRIATENTVLAMPECAIGLHPDTCSYFLSRLPSDYGMYMALTGARLKAMDVVTAGFATHFIPSESIHHVLHILQSATSPDDAFISETLTRFEKKVSPSSTLPGARLVQEVFTLQSVEEIEERLQTITNSGMSNDSDFAASALESLQSGCPTSLKLAFESLTRGKSMSLDDCLKSEFRLTSRCVRRHDFYAGVGSVLVTKDRNPTWKPSSLSLVKTEDIMQFFKPLDTDLNIPELDLDHWKTLLKNEPPQARM